MATLAATKTKIILQTSRTDLGAAAESEQALVDAIDRAIEFWADEKFWFNQTSATAATVAATQTVAIPAALRTVERVSYLGEDLTKTRLEDIQGRTETGSPPSHWAESDGTITLWPKPSAVVTLTLYGLAELGTPASASSNAWTTDALDLICATARKYLFSGYFRDVEGRAMASADEAEFLGKLRRETRRKAVTMLSTDVPTSGSSFNINRGY